MNIILFDENRENLFPFTLTRPIAEIRWGIFCIREKWEKLGFNVSYLTEDYLSTKFKCSYKENKLYVNARLVPTESVVNELKGLKSGIALHGEKDEVLALNSHEHLAFGQIKSEKGKTIDEYIFLRQPWEIFTRNDELINLDFELLTRNRNSRELSSTNTLLGKNIFIEEGAKVEASILNSNTGPIYIGKNAEVMEGSSIRGPFALCEASVVKMSAKIYGATTVGPYSKVGGEISNSVIFGYTNKGHDGFLGNSVLAEWCNLGADTNVSNLKNDYGTVKLWNVKTSQSEDTNQQFCGLMMGDHSKSGINTMFNTGTVVGVNANIFGAGFPEKFIPSFSWGGSNKMEEYRIDKALQVARRVMARRNISLSEMDQGILEHIYNNRNSELLRK